MAYEKQVFAKSLKRKQVIYKANMNPKYYSGHMLANTITESRSDEPAYLPTISYF